jgi:hypothetical protein
MSDFLLDLARRSLAVEPLVMPVLPSIFEPVTGVVIGDEWAGEVRVEVEGERPAKMMRPEGVPQAPAPTLPRPDGQPPPISTKRTQTDEPGLPRAPGVEIVRDHTERIVEQRTSERRELEVRTERTVLRDVVVSQAAAERRLPAIEEVRETPARHDPISAVPTPESPTVAVPNQPAVTAETHSITPRNETGRESPVSLHPAAPTIEAPLPRIMLPPIHESAEPTAAPSIRIHIGRVEVRAVFPAPQPPVEKPKPQSSTVMPLEEYLRRRGGRG